MNWLPRGHVSRSLPGKTHLFLSPKKQDVRQRCFNSVPYATPTIRGVVARPFGYLVFSFVCGTSKISKMGGIDRQLPRKRASQRLVCSDEGLEALV